VAPELPPELRKAASIGGRLTDALLRRLLSVHRAWREATAEYERQKVEYERQKVEYEHRKAEHEQEEAKHGRLVADHEERCRTLLAQYEGRKAEYEQQLADYQRAVRSHEKHCRALAADYKARVKNARHTLGRKATEVEKYLGGCLRRSEYPEPIKNEFSIEYDGGAETVIAAYELPAPSDLPRAKEYRWSPRRSEQVPVEMKAKEFDAFYESVVCQIALRTIHEVFWCAAVEHVKSVVFNGWVRGVDPKTGKGFRSCILSVQAGRGEFQALELSRVEPAACVKGLRGVTAGPLARLAPVRPVMDLRRDDPRFVESRPVLAGVNAPRNLAEMGWEEFEHLVRELFEAIFAQHGAEVRITRATRDRGVDAVVFDPDPIRGGKIILQAKRYNNVVPLADVRELYGTVINENANKGILVTTSYFGNDAREFVKDKPMLQLWDGSHLLYWMQEIGKKATIRLRGKARRSDGS